MESSSLISCRGLVPGFDDFEFAEKGLDIDISKGEIISIIGPDYSGKSDWLASLAGVRPPVQGSLVLAGIDSDELDRDSWSRVRRKLAYVRSDTAVLSAATPTQNVMLPALYHRMPESQCNPDVAARLLDRLGVDDHFSLPAYLRADQRFRIAIARAMILRPDALVLDAPFTQLDAVATESFQNFLLERVDQDDMSLIIVTHDVNFAIKHSNKLLFVTRDNIHLFDECDGIKRCGISYIEHFLEMNRLS